MDWVNAAFQIGGAIEAGSDAKREGRYTAKIRNEQAYDTLRATVRNETLQRDQADQGLAMQRAALSANGIDSGSGSALIGVTQAMRDSEMDALLTRYEGVFDARQEFLGAATARAQGRASQRQGYVNAAGAALNAFGNYLGRKPRTAGAGGADAPSIDRPFGDDGYPDG
jgi:hypothetical protein